MCVRFAVFLGLGALPVLAGDWSPRLAADYLDARQKVWFAWPQANRDAKPCISCHTGMPYLMARPALRKALGETEPTQYETGLFESLRSRLDKKGNGPGIGVEGIMAAMFLRTPAAYDRLFSLQLHEGETAGGFNWFVLSRDPWEEQESPLFGAALAAIAAREAPAPYRETPEARERVAALMAYVNAPHDRQPLHNRLAVAWATNDAAVRKQVIAETLARQSPDGGWSLESLGPFKTHASAPPAKPGSDAYATAFAALMLLRSGVPADDAKVARAPGWLRAHQDRASGFWEAQSMNKVYPPDSVELQFMRDAATAWAALALLDAAPNPKM